MSTIEVRLVDQQRAGRVMLALVANDNDAALRVLLEASADQSGGLLAVVVALGRYSIELLQAIDPGGAERRIIAGLTALTADN